MKLLKVLILMALGILVWSYSLSPATAQSGYPRPLVTPHSPLYNNHNFNPALRSANPDFGNLYDSSSLRDSQKLTPFSRDLYDSDFLLDGQKSIPLSESGFISIEEMLLKKSLLNELSEMKDPTHSRGGDASEPVQRYRSSRNWWSEAKRAVAHKSDLTEYNEFSSYSNALGEGHNQVFAFNWICVPAEIILSSNSLISTTALEPMNTTHANMALITPWDTSLPNVDMDELQNLSQQHIFTYFYNLGDDQIEVLHNEPGYLEFVVDNFRGEVIPGGNHWERLQFSLFFREVEQEVKIHLILDGWWASGFGKPSLSDYQEMEGEYSWEFGMYLKKSLDDIKEVLTR